MYLYLYVFCRIELAMLMYFECNLKIVSDKCRVNYFCVFTMFVIDASTLNSPVEEPDAAAKDEEDDEGLNVRHTDADASRPTVAPRWPTRVFAIECMRKVMAVCDGNDNHFSLAAAKALRQSGNGPATFCYL